ncbi:MAG: F0F1 ATP synthase subunit delta [Peptostreptococcus sp.]|uniref:F0F1 ATP synthase subunit delta n=1 Tax=Peptostreptococcus sp. TaxID=1262 RepID=UPI002FC9D332
MISQVANRYARALFELADEQNQASEIYSEIVDLNDVISSNENLYDVLRSPFIPKGEKRGVAYDLFAKEVSKDSKNFLMVLIDSDRTTELSSIVQAYKQMLNNKFNIAEGQVLTAIALSPEQISELEEKLSAKYNKDVRLTNKIDKDILGGVLVKIGNEEIDGTVKSRLGDLSEILSQVIS